MGQDANIKNQINSQITNVIKKAKVDLKKEGMKQVMKLKERVLSKEAIKEYLLSNACSIPAQEKMKKIYNKLHNLLEDLENLLNKPLELMNDIKAKMQNILDNVISNIQGIFTVLGTIINVAQIAVYLVKAILAASSGPAASGMVINQATNKQQKAVGIIRFYKAVIKGFTKTLNRLSKMIGVILGIAAIAISAIVTLLGFIALIKAFLEYLYLQYISSCNVTNNNPTNPDGSINEEMLTQNILDNDPTKLIDELDPTGNFGFTLSGELIDLSLGPQAYASLGETHDLLSYLYIDLLKELEAEGKYQIIEYLQSVDFDFKTKYEYKTVPIPPTP